tara:strand:- start:238 stop:1551 length:1314 start_codon:yes stop_codon:yes gene_type:complete
MFNKIGIIEKLLTGEYQSPFSRKNIKIPIDEIVIAKSLLNIELRHLRKFQDKKNLIISGTNSYASFGKKVTEKFDRNKIKYEIKILENYKSTIKYASSVASSLKEYENIICIGSGSVVDICKFISYQNNQGLFVYLSSLSAAATTSTVSLTNSGIKVSMKSKIPEAIIIDLDNLKMAPARLLRSALGDVLCRSTCQVDWLTSHFLLNTFYDETPFALQYEDENILLNYSQEILKGDEKTLAALSRMTLLNGIAAIIIGSTHAGSMGEHLISHYIDMFMGDRHPGSLHGEQVGIATLLLSKMQNDILNNSEIPQFKEINYDLKIFEKFFGKDSGASLHKQFQNKLFTQESLNKINENLFKNWNSYKKQLMKFAVQTDKIKESFMNCGAACTNLDLNIPSEFFKTAIENAYYLRDRFSYLDIMHYLGCIDKYSKKPYIN